MHLAALLALALAGEAAPAAAPPVEPPATRAATKVLQVLESMQNGMKETRYAHRTYIRARDGVFEMDCSAMAAWVIRRSAPIARSALTRERPVARDFYDVIRQAPLRGDRQGWRRLASIGEVRPGDVFAWRRPPDFPSANTGHVGFVLAAAEPAPGWPGAYLLRIADATSLPHQDDSRDPGGEGGFGQGTILFLADESGEGTAYGWFGAASRGVIATPIAFGRLIR